VNFAAITLCVVSQRVIPKVRVYFIIGAVRKLLDTPSYATLPLKILYLPNHGTDFDEIWYWGELNTETREARLFLVCNSPI
jgi:hypothetical protein